MATAPMLPLVPVDDYLDSSYHPDVEYVDGVLVQRGMPTPAHAVLQGILIEHLRRYRKEFGYAVASECRVEIVKGARYRIPDVLVCAAPVPRTKTLEVVPFVVFEIWSPDDRIGQQMARYREYWDRGVRQIILFEPETFDVLRYEPESLTKISLQHLELPNGAQVPFPAAELMNQLRSELA